MSSHVCALAIVVMAKNKALNNAVLFIIFLVSSHEKGADLFDLRRKGTKYFCFYLDFLDIFI